MQANAYDIIQYIYVLFFGEYVSMRIACGRLGSREWHVFLGICPTLLLLQGISLTLWDMETVRLLYPLLTHLPTVLLFILLLKSTWSRALVSVIVSYSLCQLLRWIGLVISVFSPAPAASALIHLALNHLLLIALDRFCLSAMHEVISHSSRMLSWFGVLPVFYYLYEYFTLYTDRRYTHILAVNELLPTEMVLFFVLFVTAYHHELDMRRQMEVQADTLKIKLAHAEQDISSLRAIEEQTAIYRHDLHHHLMVIDGFLTANQLEQAALYIKEADSGITALSPARYCENETLNLLLRAFTEKAAHVSARLAIKTELPKALILPDTELCVLVSNGLENALNAVALLPPNTEKTIDFFCGIRQNHLLLEIKNPFHGEVILHKGLPVSRRKERSYGCRSIRSIVQRRGGDCLFETNEHLFILRVAIPLEPIQP